MSYSFKNYSNLYPKLFEDIKRRIEVLSSRKLEIEHIGSTAVKGLGGKGVIDISIGIKKWEEADNVLKILKKLGFKHFHPIENHSLFVSTRSLCREGECHVHISRVGTKRYDRTIAFRNFLRQHHSEALRYQNVKRIIFEECNGDRKLYKKLKNEYFSKLKY